MAAIANLYNIPITPPELLVWSFIHAAHHRDIIRLVQQNYSINLDFFPLDPFDPLDESFALWLYQHQTMHDQMEDVLGLSVSNFDLTDVDWQEGESLVNWINANAIEHVQAGTILRID